MPRAKRPWSKGELLMYLDLAGLNRAHAAAVAGVSRAGFQAALRAHRVVAPKPQARLTGPQVAAVRAGLAAGVSAAPLARRYGVAPSTVGRIRQGDTWRRL